MVFVFDRKGEPLRGFIVAIVALIMATPARADDCTGLKGYYLNDAGECVLCNGEGYYCPGDGARYACPEFEGREVPLWPTEYPNMVLERTSFYGSTLTPSVITHCIINYRLTDEHGVLAYKQKYNPATDKYDLFYNIWWSYPYAGYYVTNNKSCGTNATYSAVVACPAGGYCPGKTGAWACAKGPAPENYGLEICPDNTYSADGASACTPCPARTGNSGDSIDDHAGIGSCQPIECPAGQYIGDDGRTCTPCDIGYYCPGDNDRHYCSDTDPNAPYYSDEPGLSACKPCPEVEAEYKDQFSHYWYWIDSNIQDSYLHTILSACRAGWDRNMTNGSFSFSCSCGNSGNYTTGASATKCMGGNVKCDAGYYLDRTNPVITTRGIDGGGFWTDSFKSISETEFCVPVGVGQYSPMNAETRTACPAGTSTHTNTAGDASECESLCTAGATEFHVGDYVFNIWPNSECASPAIRLGLSGGTCCVRLERNDGPGLNVDIDGTVYHTVN